MTLQFPEAIELSVKKSSFLHFPSESNEKILGNCLIVASTAESEELFNKVIGEPAWLKISMILPNLEDENKVDVYFRNINNKEILELISTQVLPEFYLDTYFGDAEVTVAENPLEEEGLISEEANREIQKVLRIQALMDANLEEVNSQQIYCVTLSLEEAHLAKTLSANDPQSPAFIVLSENKFRSLKRKPVDDRPNIYSLPVLEFPEPNTNEYYSVVSYLDQKLTGIFPFHLSLGLVNKVRGDLLSLIVNLANGSDTALIQTFKYLNAVTKSDATLTKRMRGDYSINPTTEDMEFSFLSETVDRTFKFLTLDNVLPLFTSTPEQGIKYLENVQALNDLLEGSGLHEEFEKILGERNFPELSIPPSREASLEEVSEYLEQRILPTTLPVPMIDLAGKMNFDLLYAHDWIKGVPETLPDNISSGAVTVAKILALAVRYGRLQTLVETAEAPINPIAILMRALSDQSEMSIWAPAEAIRLLPQRNQKDGLFLFTQVLTSGLIHPSFGQESLPIEFLLRSLITHVLHRVGHMITNEQFEKGTIETLLPEYSYLLPFVDALYPEEENSSSGQQTCIPLEATVNVLTQTDFSTQGRALVEETGMLLIDIANIKAAEAFPEGNEKDPAWKEFVETYLVNQIIFNGLAFN